MVPTQLWGGPSSLCSQFELLFFQCLHPGIHSTQLPIPEPFPPFPSLPPSSVSSLSLPLLTWFLSLFSHCRKEGHCHQTQTSQRAGAVATTVPKTVHSWCTLERSDFTDLTNPPPIRGNLEEAGLRLESTGDSIVNWEGSQMEAQDLGTRVSNQKQLEKLEFDRWASLALLCVN